MKVAPIPSGTLFVDTSQKLTEAMLDVLVAYHGDQGQRVGGVARYAPFSDQSAEGKRGCFDADEVQRVHARGLGFLPLQHVRYPGWHPSYELGSADGIAMVQWCRSAGLPIEDGLCLAYDLEGPTGDAADSIAYDRGHTDITRRVGALPMAYLGYGVPLDATQRWQLQVKRYWRAGGDIIAPLNCEWCVRQLLPLDQEIAPGFRVDFDVALPDKLGRLPYWAVP